MIEPSELSFVGHDLHRPECVLATASGHLHVADWRGGVTVIAPDGTQESVLAKGAFRPRPNGIAIVQDGWLLAHLGESDGGVWHLARDGTCQPLLQAVDGIPLPPTNYVHVDGLGRIWITVSTRLQPRNLGYRKGCDDGFIVLLDHKGARIVADGLGYTNECLVHPETGQLWVNETFGRRLTRFDVSADGSLGNRTVVTEFGAGTFPDGLAFDAEGGVWITSIVSNRVIRVARDGSSAIVLEDCDPDHLAWVEAAWLADEMGREHLDRTAGRVLKNISSLAFGGPDLRTAYLGCLLGDRLAHFRTDVAGLAPVHWGMGA